MDIEVRLTGGKAEITAAWKELQDRANLQVIDKMILVLYGPVFIKTSEWADLDQDKFPGRVELNANLVVGDGMKINLVTSGEEGIAQ